MDIRNPVENEVGGVDCEIDHPDLGWIPFSAFPGSDDHQISAVWDAVQKMEISPRIFPPIFDQVSSASAEVERVHSEMLRSASAAGGEERDTWPSKVEAAEAVASLGDSALQREIEVLVSGSPEAFHSLATMVGDVGDNLGDLRELSRKIIQRDLEYKMMIGKASGIRRRAKEAISNILRLARSPKQAAYDLENVISKLSDEAEDFLKRDRE